MKKMRVKNGYFISPAELRDILLGVDLLRRERLRTVRTLVEQAKTLDHDPEALATCQRSLLASKSALDDCGRLLTSIYAVLDDERKHDPSIQAAMGTVQETDRMVETRSSAS